MTGILLESAGGKGAAHSRLVALLLSGALVAVPAAARAKLTVLTYSYNVDGALTAVTTQNHAAAVLKDLGF